MVTTGSKLFFGLSAVAFVAAIVYGLTTGGHLWGVLSLGYKEGVGEHFGYATLLFVGCAAAILGVASSIARDGELPVEEAARAAVAYPSRAQYWPILGAFGAGLMIVGLALEPILFALGLLIAGIVAIEWVVNAWADSATGDPDANATIRNRLMRPIEVPVFGVLIAGFIALLFSRLLLAVTELGAVIAAGVAAAIVVAVAFTFAYAKTINKSLLTGALVVGAVAILVSGIVGSALGEREFHHEGEGEEHSTDEGDEAPESEEGALVVVSGVDR